MSVIKKLPSLRYAFAAALMLGLGTATADAQRYEMGGRGGSGISSYNYVELLYPGGDSRRILYPFGISRLSDDEKDQFRSRITPILEDYVQNVLPQLSPAHYREFAFVVMIMSGHAGADEEEFSRDIGYDYSVVEERRSDFKTRRFERDLRELNTPYTTYGSHGVWITPSAMFIDERAVDEFNELLQELQTEFPNDPRYQIPAYTYDVLYDLRMDLADALATVMVQFDTYQSHIDPDTFDQDTQKFLSTVARILSEPENVDSRDASNARFYNEVMPEYIDEALRFNHRMTEDERNDLYRTIFTLRGSYDYRPLPNEDYFLSGRNVIGAPKP